jgi:hypothetical protein
MANIAAIAICIILIFAGIFQALLASGKPWGEWAYGGQNEGVLPRELRISSVLAIFVYLFQILHYLGQAQVIGLFFSTSINEVINWVMVAFFALGTLMNGISRSKKERNLWTPILLVSLICSFLVAFDAN